MRVVVCGKYDIITGWQKPSVRLCSANLVLVCSVEPNVEPELNDRPTQAVNVTAVAFAGSWPAPTPQGALNIRHWMGRTIGRQEEEVLKLNCSYFYNILHLEVTSEVGGQSFYVS